jgi:hypothetical protein
MANSFTSTTNQNLNAPAYSLQKVTLSDTVALPGGVCRGLLVGTAGAVDLIDASGTLCSAVPLQVGYNPIGVTRINATNAAASNIWAIY